MIPATVPTAFTPYGTTAAVAPAMYNPYAPAAVVGGVGEIDKVNAFGQVVERDFVGGVPTYAAPGVVPSVYNPVAATTVAPSVINPLAPAAVYGGVGEIDRVNAFGQVVERDFVGGVPTYAAPGVIPGTTALGGVPTYAAPVASALPATTAMTPYGPTMVPPMTYGGGFPAVAPTYATTAMPATTAVAAAPYATYGAAPVTTVAAAPSYVAAPAMAAPVVAAAPSYVAPPVAAAPQNLLAGIPDPKIIESQRKGFEDGLQKQYVDGASAIKAETALKQKMLQDQAQAQKEQYKLQVESQLQAQNLMLDQQMNSQMMMLQEAAMAQRSALEQQAAALTLEYQQKKAEEEMLKKQYEIQCQFVDAENKLATQFNKVAAEEQAEMLKAQQQAAALGVGLPQAYAAPGMMV